MKGNMIHSLCKFFYSCVVPSGASGASAGARARLYFTEGDVEKLLTVFPSPLIRIILDYYLSLPVYATGTVLVKSVTRDHGFIRSFHSFYQVEEQLLTATCYVYKCFVLQRRFLKGTPFFVPVIPFSSLPRALVRVARVDSKWSTYNPRRKYRAVWLI